MGIRNISKSLAGVEDLLLDNQTHTQTRNGSSVDITGIHAGELPYYPSGTGAVERTIEDKLNEVVSVKDFGAVGDGVTDDFDAIQAAIDYAYSIGGGTVLVPQPSNFYLHTEPFIARTNVTFFVPNKTTKFYNDGSLGEYWSSASWMGCSIGGAAIRNNNTYYDFATLTKGSRTVTLTTASDSDNFSVGDIVQIRTKAEYTVSTYYHATYQETNIVTGISSGVLTLKYPAEEDHSTLWITNLSTITYLMTGAGSPTGGSSKNFTLLGGHWETNDSYFCTQFYCIDSQYHPYSIKGKNGLGYSGGSSHCKMSVVHEDLTATSLDLANGTSTTEIRKGSVVTTMTAGDQVINFSETSRNNSVYIQSLSIVGTPSLTNAVVNLVAARNNKLEIDNVFGDLTAGDTVSIQQLNYTGTNVDTYSNSIIINNSRLDTQDKYVYLNDAIGTGTVYRNKVEGNFYGNADTENITFVTGSENNIILGYFENGKETVNSALLLNDLTGVTTGTLQTLKDLEFYNYSETVTSAAPYTKTITIPAGTLQIGDRIIVRIAGVKNGTTDTVTTVINFDSSAKLNRTSPTATTDCFYEVEMVIIDTTQLYLTQHIKENTTSEFDIGYKGSINMATTAYDVDISLTMSGATDNFGLRFFDVIINRPAYSNNRN